MYVKGKKSNIQDGFAFPYIWKDCMKQSGNVVFAILNYECSLRLISTKRLEICQYNDYLDRFKIDELSCDIHIVKEHGISFEYDDEIKDSHLTELVKSTILKSSPPVWKISGRRIGIWKKTPTVNINDLDSIRHILHRTYGNFGFDRSRSKCFGLNTYTGIHSIFSFSKHFFLSFCSNFY